MGKVPAVRFPDGDVLTDSGALLFHFADRTRLWPTDRRMQAEVLRWMFFEQYSHEPALAVLRYLRRFAPDSAMRATRMAELEPKCDMVLDVLEDRLSSQDWIVSGGMTIADLALYPYTRLAGEVGFDPARRPAIARWIERIECQPRHLPVYADAATEAVAFDAYFGSRRDGQ
jgi:glutathione S-transferase